MKTIMIRVVIFLGLLTLAGCSILFPEATATPQAPVPVVEIPTLGPATQPAATTESLEQTATAVSSPTVMPSATSSPTTVPSPTVPPTLPPTVPPTLPPAVSPTVPPTAPPASGPPLPPTIAADGRVYIGDRLLLNPEVEAPGCFSGGVISESPTGDHFLVVLDCFEGDNTIFIFDANGNNKRRVAGANWDYLSYRNYEWSPDGRSFTYRRTNSCCATPPPGTVLPIQGLVRVDVATLAKAHISLFYVVDVEPGDVLNMRAGPGVQHPVVGSIPPDGRDVRVTGDGVMVGESLWAPVAYGGEQGWVNMRYLFEQ